MATNVVLIVLDSVRKDVFDEKARKVQELSNISFQQCRSAAPWSAPSHASMLTGQLPHQHRITKYNIDFSTIEKQSISDVLGEEATSYCTSANHFISSNFGIDSLFDQTIYSSHMNHFPEGLNANTSAGALDHIKRSLQHNRPFYSLLNGVIGKSTNLLDGTPLPSIVDDGGSLVIKNNLNKVDWSDSPLFLFSNFMEAHFPHRDLLQYSSTEVPNSWSSAQEFEPSVVNQSDSLEKYKRDIKYFRELYEESISYLDQVVASFIKSTQRKTDDETIFVITSDHGDNLGFESEDRLFGHGGSISEGLLHVPLEIIAPKAEQKEIDDFVSLADLPDIISSLRDKSSIYVPNHKYIAAERIGSSEQESNDVAMRCLFDTNTNEKYVWDSDGNTSHYSLPTEEDSTERKIDSESPPDIVTEIFDIEITEWREIESGNGTGIKDVPEHLEDQLEDLGYL